MSNLTRPAIVLGAVVFAACSSATKTEPTDTRDAGRRDAGFEATDADVDQPDATVGGLDGTVTDASVGDAGPGISAAPVFSLPSGQYTYGTASTLTAAANAQIFYTLNGGDPTSSSIPYVDPIRVIHRAATIEVRAIAIEPGLAPSAVASAEYTLEPGMIIHFKKPTSWAAANIHYWNSVPSNLSTEWPGAAMQPSGDDWYDYFFPDQTAVNIVFNAGVGQAQTADLYWNKPEGWFVGDDFWDVDPSTFDCCTYPNGKTKALVMSFDDGNLQDQRLIEIFNRLGIKGSFHLNSGFFGRSDKVPQAEVATTYAGHEVSVHSVNHPHITADMNQVALRAEIEVDKTNLEAVVGYPVRGMAYPFGDYTQTLIDLLPGFGIEYARIVPATNDFRLPADLLRWKGSTHHTGAEALAQPFVALSPQTMQLLFIWGHSWELDGGGANNNWTYMESVCQTLSGHDDIWYASAIEISDYMHAIRKLFFAPDGRSVRNDSTQTIWFRDDAGPTPLAPGATRNL